MALNATDIGSGLDHADIPAWIASITTASDSYVGTCQTAADHSGGSNYTYNGTAPSGAEYRILTADTDVRMTKPTYSEASAVARSNRKITVTTAGLEIEGLAFDRNDVGIDTQVGVEINRVFCRKSIRAVSGGAGGTVILANVIVQAGLSSGIALWQLTSGFTIKAYHCTFSQSGTNGTINTSGLTAIECYACIAENPGSGSAFDTRGTGDELVSDDTSASGTATTTSWDSQNALVYSGSTSARTDSTLRLAVRDTYDVSDYTGSADVGTDFFGRTRSSGSRHAGAIEPPSTPSNTLLDNLVAFWEGDEAGGANDLVDDDGGTHTLPHNGSPGSEEGIHGAARLLDGTDDYFQEASHSATFAGNQEFYAAGWVRFDVTTGLQSLTGSWSPVDFSNSSWRLYGESGNIKFRLHDGTTNDGPDFALASLAVNEWVFVECFYNPSTDVATVCVDRGADATDSMASTGTIQEGNKKFTIGAGDNGGSRATGAVQNWGVWSAIPSTADRDALFNSRHGLGYADFSAGSTTTTITPTGVDVIVEAGAPKLTRTLRSTGADAVVEAGTPAVQVVLHTTGAEVVVEAGAPSVSQTAAIHPGGAEVVVEAGTPSQAHTARPTGVQTIVEAGTPSLRRDLRPFGADVVVEAGAPTVTIATRIYPTGADVVVEAGAPQLSYTVRPSGTQVTVKAGTPAVGIQMHPLGVDAIVEAGAPTIVIATRVYPTGVEVICAAGAPKLHIDARPGGIDVVCVAGAPSAQLILRPTGIEAITAAGSPVVSYAALISPTGVEVIVGAGAPTVSLALHPNGSVIIVEAGRPTTTMTLHTTGIELILAAGSPVVTIGAAGISDISTYRERLYAHYDTLLLSGTRTGYASTLEVGYESVLRAREE